MHTSYELLLNNIPNKIDDSTRIYIKSVSRKSPNSSQNRHESPQIANSRSTDPRIAKIDRERKFVISHNASNQKLRESSSL